MSKDSARINANGSVDEAQAHLGVARAKCAPGGELDTVLIEIEHDLYLLMAELATAPANRHKLTPGKNQLSEDRIRVLEGLIDAYTERFELPKEFVVPGEDELAASLDVARAVVRRAERDALGVEAVEETLVIPYLNRLSDLCWTLARWCEAEATGGSRASRSS